VTNNLPTTFPAIGRVEADRRRALLALRGIPAAVPAEPIRRHIHALNDLGVNDGMIASAAGLPVQTIKYIVEAESQTTRIHLAAAIRSVSHLPHPRQKRVLAVGARRRVQALRRLGWRESDIAEQIGITAATLHMCLLRSITINRDRWQSIADLYEQISATPGPNTQAAQHATRQGWPAPLDWEGLDIDDPRVAPSGVEFADEVDEVLVERILAGTWAGEISRTERRAAYERLEARGATAAEIAERLNTTKRTVVRYRAASVA
jgi:transcriptional regulator